MNKLPVPVFKADFMDLWEPFLVRVFICGVPGRVWPKAFM